MKKHWEVLSYLIFGVLTTLLNIVLYAVFNRLFGYEAANSWGNVLDNILCILFAYVTNRAFVFNSRTSGKEAAAEFGKFVSCRLGTMVLDAVIMMVGGNLLAAQGAALVERLFGGIAVFGGASGSTAVFVTGKVNAQNLWGLGVKVFSNVIVVVLNYVFSKLIVFKK